MEAFAASSSGSNGPGHIGIAESYTRLPFLYFSLMLVWFLSVCLWTYHTCRTRHFQINKLQWTLTSVPLIKALQLMLCFLFWSSCFYAHVCSLLISFGVYLTGVLSQAVTFVAFLIISHGYCITRESLSVFDRRTTASLGCVFYLTLIGYRASIPYFSVLLVLNYSILFYVIFSHIYQNLLLLREQLTIVENEDVPGMHDAIYMKYTMLKKFQCAMHIVAVAELAIFINMESSVDSYWLRLLIREWAHFSIILFIGWTFKSKDLGSNFGVTLKPEGKRRLPPIYSIEMDGATFRDFNSHEWHIGVPTSSSKKGSLPGSVLVVIQHPRMMKSISALTTS
ncbi:unnamed protein product [Cuscuta europaea]|uniref:Transmembrane protein n=1 Tax=Cuscuta europaea TaxID=41803 RepID=A0A9P0Z775_CUSEU|nr:unnamed protein product [Cuscuta europaea]